MLLTDEKLAAADKEQGVEEEPTLTAVNNVMGLQTHTEAVIVGNVEGIDQDPICPESAEQAEVPHHFLLCNFAGSANTPRAPDHRFHCLPTLSAALTSKYQVTTLIHNLFFTLPWSSNVYSGFAACCLVFTSCCDNAIQKLHRPPSYACLCVYSTFDIAFVSWVLIYSSMRPI